MTCAVRYFSRTGNTKKVADAVAAAVGTTAETTATPLTEKVDVLFLGSAVYAAGVDTAIQDFIKANADKIGAIANFSTTALLTSTYPQVKKIADANGVKMLEKEFHCKGKFTAIHTNRPNEKDLAAAADFAKAVIAG